MARILEWQKLRRGDQVPAEAGALAEPVARTEWQLEMRNMREVYERSAEIRRVIEEEDSLENFLAKCQRSKDMEG